MTASLSLLAMTEEGVLASEAWPSFLAMTEEAVMASEAWPSQIATSLRSSR